MSLCMINERHNEVELNIIYSNTCTTFYCSHYSGGLGNFKFVIKGAKNGNSD